MNNKKIYILSILFTTSVAATQEVPTPNGETMGSMHSSIASEKSFIPPLEGNVIDYTFMNSFTDVNSSSLCVLFDPEIIIGEVGAILTKERSEAKSTSDVTLLAVTLTNSYDNLSRKYLLSSNGMLESKAAIKMAEQVGYHILKVNNIPSEEKAHVLIQLLRFLSACDGATSLGIYPSSPLCEQCSLLGQEVFKTSLYGVESGCCGKSFPNKLPDEVIFYLEAFFSFDFSKQVLSKKTPGKVEEEKESVEKEEKQNFQIVHKEEKENFEEEEKKQDIINYGNAHVNQSFSGGARSGALRSGALRSRNSSSNSSNVIIQTQIQDELNQKIIALKKHIIYLKQELLKSQKNNELLQKENSSLKMKMKTMNIAGMDENTSKASVHMAMQVNTQLLGLIENLANTNQQHAVTNQRYADANQQNVYNVNRLANINAAHSNNIKNLTNVNAAHSNNIKNLTNVNAAHSNNIKNLTNANAAHANNINDLTNANAAHANNVDKLTNVNAAHANNIKNLTNANAAHANNINDLTNTNAAHANNIKNLEDDIDNLTNANAVYANNINDLTNTNAVYANNIKNLEDDIDKLTNTNAVYANNINDLTNTNAVYANNINLLTNANAAHANNISDLEDDINDLTSANQRHGRGNTLNAAANGAIAGGLMAGPAGAAVGAATGGVLGYFFNK